MKWLRTDIQYPTQTNGWNEATIPETLYPQSKREASPGPDEVFGSLPKEDSEGASHYSGDRTGKNEHALQCLVRRIYGRKNAKLDDENEADQ
jgi:hypothetical protein